MLFRIKLPITAIAVLFLAACNSSSDDPLAPGATATLPTFINGPITSFADNTLNINGRSIDIAHADVSYANTLVPKDTLIPGMNVRLETNGKTVTAIELNPDLAGKVTSTAEGTITLNNITVQIEPAVSAMTASSVEHSSNQAVHNIRVGDYVVVTSALSEDNTITANAVVSLENEPLYIEVEGPLIDLDTSAQTFTLNQLKVDYAAASLPDEALSNGMWVEVFGSFTEEGILAVEIELESFDDDMEAEISGRITWVNDAQTRFELSRRMQFDILPTTKFDDGVQQDLTVGRWVEVEIEIINGEYFLTEVEFEDEDDIGWFERSFEVAGTMALENESLVFNGFTFVLTAYTDYDDNLTVDSLDGTFLEIEGVERNGQFLIFEVELADDDNEIDLEGFVQDGSLWGYTADDNSLDPFEGQWVEVECKLNGLTLSNCSLD